MNKNKVIQFESKLILLVLIPYQFENQRVLINFNLMRAKSLHEAFRRRPCQNPLKIKIFNKKLFIKYKHEFKHLPHSYRIQSDVCSSNVLWNLLTFDSGHLWIKQNFIQCFFKKLGKFKPQGIAVQIGQTLK